MRPEDVYRHVIEYIYIYICRYIYIYIRIYMYGSMPMKEELFSPNTVIPLKKRADDISHISKYYRVHAPCRCQRASRSLSLRRLGSKRILLKASVGIAGRLLEMGEPVLVAGTVGSQLTAPEALNKQSAEHPPPASRMIYTEPGFPTRPNPCPLGDKCRKFNLPGLLRPDG